MKQRDIDRDKERKRERKRQKERLGEPIIAVKGLDGTRASFRTRRQDRGPVSLFNTSAAAAKTRLSCVETCPTPDCCPALPFQIARWAWWPTARSWSWPPWNVPGCDAFRFRAPSVAYDSRLAAGSNWPAKGEGTWCWARLARSSSVAASSTDWPEGDGPKLRCPSSGCSRLMHRHHHRRRRRRPSTPSRQRCRGEGSSASAPYARRVGPDTWSTPRAAARAEPATRSISLPSSSADPPCPPNVPPVRPGACSCLTRSRTLCSASVWRTIKRLSLYCSYRNIIWIEYENAEG